jgi:hypothetical protein
VFLLKRETSEASGDAKQRLEAALSLLEALEKAAKTQPSGEAK